ncbi:hypothetical protein ACF0H5_004408 [Mactra antiquata]
MTVIINRARTIIPSCDNKVTHHMITLNITTTQVKLQQYTNNINEKQHHPNIHQTGKQAWMRKNDNESQLEKPLD